MKFLIMIILLISACSSKTTTGTGPGFGGALEVSVALEDGKIAAINVLNHNESSYVGGRAFDILEKDIVAYQTPEVDNVSGATYTSYAYKFAVAKALEALKFGTYKISINTELANKAPLTNGSDVFVDVLIIGGGGAGLSAAIAATDKGSDVLLVEKMSLIGGNTLYATGGMNAAGTAHQTAQGITNDSPQIFFEDTMKGGKNLNDPQLVRILVDESSNTVEWLATKGVDLSYKITSFGGASRKRVHKAPNGNAVGPYLVEGLYNAATKAGVDMRVDTRATGLDIQDGVIRGVSVEDKNTKYNIIAKAVIIATGGFGANLDLAASYNPQLEGFKTSNQKGATGDIFPIADQSGIQLRDMDQIQIHPTGEASRGLLITEAVRGSGGILINEDGERFVNELLTRDVVSKAIIDQRPSKVYLIYDEQVRKDLGAIKTYESLNLVKSGGTIDALAKTLRVNGENLAKTLEDYNNSVSGAQSDTFGRTSFAKPLSTSSYYGIGVYPVLHHTMGGIRVNTNSQVLLRSGSPVRGLFAAGEVVGGIHGANRLGGNAVADIVIFGRRSGNQAADYAQSN